MYKIKNMTFVKNQSNIVESEQNNDFLMYVFFKKKTVNVLQKYIIFSYKELSLQKSYKKYKKNLPKCTSKSKLL